MSFLGLNCKVEETLSYLKVYYGLKDKEIELCRLIYLGYSNKDIAKFLGVRHRNIEYKLCTLYKKLGCRNRFDLVAILNKKRQPVLPQHVQVIHKFVMKNKCKYTYVEIASLLNLKVRFVITIINYLNLRDLVKTERQNSESEVIRYVSKMLKVRYMHLKRFLNKYCITIDKLVYTVRKYKLFL
jgi:DNA-binding CsgD family transcriptional regulator